MAKSSVASVFSKAGDRGPLSEGGKITLVSVVEDVPSYVVE